MRSGGPVELLHDEGGALADHGKVLLQAGAGPVVPVRRDRGGVLGDAEHTQPRALCGQVLRVVVGGAARVADESADVDTVHTGAAEPTSSRWNFSSRGRK